jgi:hypothetical protein
MPMLKLHDEYLMVTNLRAWYILLKLLVSLSNELGMVYTLILFFLKGFSMVYTKLFSKKADRTKFRYLQENEPLGRIALRKYRDRTTENGVL